MEKTYEEQAMLDYLRDNLCRGLITDFDDVIIRWGDTPGEYLVIDMDNEAAWIVYHGGEYEHPDFEEAEWDPEQIKRIIHRM